MSDSFNWGFARLKESAAQGISGVARPKAVVQSMAGGTPRNLFPHPQKSVGTTSKAIL